MPRYLKHASRERARFRHPALANGHVRASAMEVLQKQQGIAGIKPGPESLLIFLEPGADLPAICQELEKALPQLADKGNDKGAAGESVKTARQRSSRKTVLKAYLATGVTTVTLAALGFHHWHAFMGCVFTLFGIDHVWVRRKAL